MGKWVLGIICCSGTLLFGCGTEERTGSTGPGSTFPLERTVRYLELEEGFYGIVVAGETQENPLEMPEALPLENPTILGVRIQCHGWPRIPPPLLVSSGEAPPMRPQLPASRIVPEESAPKLAATGNPPVALRWKARSRATLLL